MEEIKVDNISVNILSSKDMADYIEQALNNERVIDVCFDKSDFNILGHLLQAYAVATGDLSNGSVEKIIDNFSKNKDQLSIDDERNKLTGRQIYFQNNMLDDIMQYHARKLGINKEDIAKNRDKILSSIYLQCKNNIFMTHSFSGKLADKVEKEGLNADNELFTIEFQALEKAGMKTPFKKGMICFCELSHATFGYAEGVPERVGMTIGKRGRAQDETMKEVLTRNLSEKLDNNDTLNEEEKDIVLLAGRRIIDFYCEKSESAIAFMRQPFSVDEPDKRHLQFEYKDMFCKNHLLVKSFLRDDKEMQEEYISAAKHLGEGCNFGEEQIAFIEKINQKYPNNRFFKNFYSNTMTKYVTQNCLACFCRNGYADGYKAQRIEPDKFSVARIPAAGDLFAIKKKKLIRQTEEKLITEKYQQQLYDQKYKFEIKSGRIPLESFEEFQTKNPHNPHSVSFLSFRNTQGYNNSKHPNYIAIHEEARKIVLSPLKKEKFTVHKEKTMSY